MLQWHCQRLRTITIGYFSVVLIAQFSGVTTAWSRIPKVNLEFVRQLFTGSFSFRSPTNSVKALKVSFSQWHVLAQSRYPALKRNRHRVSTSTRWPFAFALCCHNNENRAPIANLPNSAQLEGILYHSSNLHPGPHSSVGMQRGTDRQTAMTTIHFASSTTHAKSNNTKNNIRCILFSLSNQSKASHSLRTSNQRHTWSP